jgi:hypothetical protein
MTPATFLPEYLRKFDDNALDVLPMLAPEFTFSVLWSDDQGAKEFTGGFDEYHGYLAQREPEGQLHHVNVTARDGRTEVVTGHTTKFGEPLGSFTFAVELDEQERAVRMFAARTLAFQGRPF